jgi:hypothetical protein
MLNLALGRSRLPDGASDHRSSLAKWTNLTRIIWCACAFAFVSNSGCSQRLGSVSGKVTYRDRPVTYGTVLALCSDGLTRNANIEPDGSYRFENIPTGEVKFAVLSPEPADPDVSARKGGRDGPASGSIPTIDKSKWFAIPEELGDPRRANAATVVNGVGIVYNIQLR